MTNSTVNEQTYFGIWTEHTVEELESMPTITQGQADDLKIEREMRSPNYAGPERVWLSRCTVGDGEPWDNKVTIEHYIDGSWIEVEWWEAA
jgi:hypothetical protein